MLKILSQITSRITGSSRAEYRDAKKIYAKTMRQSRSPAFFTPEFVADDFDGRMEVLCLHLSLITYRLRQLGDNGLKLSQALYDTMVEDFDIALREECLTDSGVSRRIKPMVLMFLTRVKMYADALDAPENLDSAIEEVIRKTVMQAETEKDHAVRQFKTYTQSLHQTLAQTSLGDIANCAFEFPNFNSQVS